MQYRLEDLIQGKKETIRLLYDTLYPKVTNFVLKNKGNFKDAEEIFHDALFQLIVRAKVKKIQINNSLEAYIFTICKNLWYAQLNKRKKEIRKDGIFELKSEDHTLENMLNQERWDLFQEKLLKLSDNCQQLLKDYFNKVSYDIIVKKFNYTTKNVAFQRIFKCKKRLTELIKLDVRYKNL